MAHNEYTHLTAEELCERLNAVRERMGYGDTKVSYQGRGWYHRHTSGMTGSFSERRRNVEDSLRRFEKREKREEAERPAREAAVREEARRRALHLAASDTLSALKAMLDAYAPYAQQTVDKADGDENVLHRAVRDARAAIAKAEGRAP